MFEQMMEDFGYDSMDQLVYELCKNEVDFGEDYIFKNEFPDYSLNKTNPELYNKLRDLRKDEREGPYKDYVQANKDKYGYEHLKQEGGGEGGSEYCYGVFKLGGKIYKAEYSYYSYNGHEYDGIYDTLKEVKPVQKTITVYE